MKSPKQMQSFSYFFLDSLATIDGRSSYKRQLDAKWNLILRKTEKKKQKKTSI